MEQEKNISPEESLNLIQKIIHSSQNKYSENGVIIMLASGLFALASAVDFVLSEIKIEVEPIFIYIVPFFISVAYRQLFYPTPEEKKFQSFADEHFSHFISAFNVTAFFIGMYCNNYHVPATQFQLILLFNFCIVTALIFNKNIPFVIGAILMLITATVCKLVLIKFYPLMMTAALLIGIFFPALLMYLKSKKESV